MKVLVACEYSGIVRDAFTALGHYAMSCDLLPTESDGPHYQGDVFDVLNDGWDLMVAHPPCTYLTNAANGSLEKVELSRNGALTGPARWKALIDGAAFFRALLNAPIPRVAIENPRMNPYAVKVIGRNRDQSVQPYQFGHLETKEIGLWLRGLPPLVTTEDVKAATMALPYGERAKVHYASPGVDRSKIRSRFFEGVGAAMAQQWGGDVREAVA
jgi:hypothetical protein